MLEQQEQDRCNFVLTQMVHMRTHYGPLCSNICDLKITKIGDDLELLKHKVS